MMRIVSRGIAHADIVIPDPPEPVERFAAEELQKYLGMICGASVPIRRATGPEATVGSRGRIRIGPTLGEHSGQPLGHDGFVVRASGNEMLLAGARPHSCLYAVYHLLERHLGCGFFEDGEQVPKADLVEVGDIDEACTPRFEWRRFDTCIQDAYSGMRWWVWDEMKPWVEWLAKRRYNILETVRMTAYCGIGTLAFRKLGVRVELSEWQERRIALLRRVFSHARMMGIRIMFPIGELTYPADEDRPGVHGYAYRRQFDEAIRAFERQSGRQVRLVDYTWCGIKYSILGPSDPLFLDFVKASVETYAEVFGTDHLYKNDVFQEGGYKDEDPELRRQVTYNYIMKTMEAVCAGDPQAVIFQSDPYPYDQVRYPAQKKAVQDSGGPVTGDFINVPNRLYGHLANDWYWGSPWTAQFLLTCGKHTNLNGDLGFVVSNARAVASDPRAANCRGAGIISEINHRNVMMAEAIAELIWNPSAVEPEDYLRRFARRRYGAAASEKALPAILDVASTLLSCDNMDTTNHPHYRQWGGGYLPGLTPRSAKRTLSWLPRLRRALEVLAGLDDALAENSFYRFDLVDLGRTYLGAIFNDRLARARAALRRSDAKAFEEGARQTVEVMRFTARYCSAHPQFRLKTMDDLAARWPPVLPGFQNAEQNWMTFTNLTNLGGTSALIDYMAEDYCELIEHYFLPRVQRYLDSARKLLQEGRSISGRLVYPGTDTPIPYRISDYATPRGECPWSAYGVPCEPELSAGDLDLARQIIGRGSVSGRYDYYEGPLGALLRELLERFPVPADLPQVLAEPDDEGWAKVAAGRPGSDGTAGSLKGEVVAERPGDTQSGFHLRGVVEQAVVPPELAFLVRVERMSEEYNVTRGGIASYRVDVSDALTLRRLPDAHAEIGGYGMPCFQFDVLGAAYSLLYDPGSPHMISRLVIEKMRGRP